ncbi:MAG: hypothetical protein LBM98_11435 [Oscillospiraceae bacterium]|nr:hypothetical protein [Oscillospiraceae bacterium]
MLGLPVLRNDELLTHVHFPATNVQTLRPYPLCGGVPPAGGGVVASNVQPHVPIPSVEGCRLSGGVVAPTSKPIPLLGGVPPAGGGVVASHVCAPSKAPLFRGGCRLSGGGCYGGYEGRATYGSQG